VEGNGWRSDARHGANNLDKAGNVGICSSKSAEIAPVDTELSPPRADD
jgi:hypothetical protein